MVRPITTFLALWAQSLVPRPRPHTGSSTGKCEALAPKQESEILEPEPTYNATDLSPQDFLVAVYQNKKLPMQTRIEAAKAVSVYMHPRLAQVTQDITAGITIRIEGGLPALPGTNIIMPEHNKPGIPKKGNGHDPET